MTQDYASSLIGQQLGDYRIEGVLGRGGMGAVLRGRDVKLDRDVALKVIGQEFGGQAGEAYGSARDRFLREAKTLAGLAHPNLIHLYAVGDFGGKHYFAMELVRGPTLGQWIQRFGPLRGAAAVRFAAQMLSALSTVHATGYVHRDIKPGNIMLDCTAQLGGRKDNAVPILDQLAGDEVHSGRWVLMDFGLAKLTLQTPESGLTQQGVILGTPDTMSPEQAQGFETTAVSDLYSFGVVLYLALTGKLPFTAPSAMGVIQKHLMEPAPGLDKHWPEAPVAWREVVAKSLQKDPATRFQAEWEVAAALAGQVDELPELRELARPPRSGLTGASLAAEGTAPSGIKPGSTALIETKPVVVAVPASELDRDRASARTVSPTDVTIRDAVRPGSAGPQSVAEPAKPANMANVAKPGAVKSAGAKPAPAKANPSPAPPERGSALVNNPKKGGTKKAGAVAGAVGKAPTVVRGDLIQPSRRWLAGLAALVVVGALGVLIWWLLTPPPVILPPPLPPPPVLEQIPANAFWAADPAHPGQKIAIHWVGMDPTTQQYLIEVYNPATKAWDEQQVNHDQMMKFGDLKKPAAEDKTYPR